MPDIQQEIKNTKRRFAVIGEAPALISAIGRAIRVAPHDLSVLVIGESGSGKEFFPKIIHENSPRKHKKYIAVNCGAIPEGTIDSELFGHVKGSFTGATSDHKGYFEEANGGTIFLDEVAEMPMGTQARLLRVLESGEFMRVGSSTVQKTNIRVVAATNKNMEQAIKEGRFREDLYFRLSTVQINVPPLRERGNDILLLTRKFMHDFIDETNSPEVEFTPEARQALLDFHWPGNVRQLRSVVQQLALFEAGNIVDIDKLHEYIPKGGALIPGSDGAYDYTREREIIFKSIVQLQQQISELQLQMQTASNVARVSADTTELMRTPKQLPMKHHDIVADYDMPHGKGMERPVEAHEVQAIDEVPAYEVHDNTSHAKTLDESERELITEALWRNNGKRKKTAQELQISERTLYRKIKQYGLERR